MTRSLLTILALVLFSLAAAPGPARAACANPAGAAGAIIYNADLFITQYCDDTNWVEMHAPGSGTGGCSNPTAAAGSIIYNATERVPQACAGNQWMAMGPLGGGTGAGWISVSLGGEYGCAVRSNGTLWCWGEETYDHLGDGATTGTQFSPVQESTGATNWASVSASPERHTCAVKTTGALWCWGDDFHGQLGNGAAGNQVSPDQESTAATNWASVSTGFFHTCARKTNGTLWCWGGDNYGQLGNGAAGDQVNPDQESTAATDWASVSTATWHTCAVKTNGTLWCWGLDSSGQLGNGATTGNQPDPVQESTLATNWASVSAGSAHTCAVKTTGTLWCWGDDTYEQLGNGATTGDQISPVQEATFATDWTSVSAGFYHSCARKTNGTLWCWGNDGFGQLGNGATTGNQVSPVQESTGATDWGVSAANNGGVYGYTCAIKTDNTLWCWGSAVKGHLGTGLQSGSRDTPAQEYTQATDWASVSASNDHTCARKTNGTLRCCGDNGQGESGNGTFNNGPEYRQEVTLATDWAAVDVGWSYTCARKTNGTLWCWGSDFSGKLGNGVPTGDQNSPTQESTLATDWASVSASSDDHTCAVKTNGTLWCWGRDADGELGNGAVTGSRASPTQESTLATDWASVSAGSAHTCAVKTTGTLWCWGDDTYEQLGNGATTGDQISPVQESTAATNWASVSAGAEHTCARKTTGTVWCWGNDFNGQLGNGATTGTQVSPVQESTAATDWVSVSANGDHTCAVKTNGTLWCWGTDFYGQLGNGATAGDQISPVQEFTSATNWASVSAGLNYTCAARTNGTIWCWGEGMYYKHCLGPEPDSSSPLPQVPQGVLIYNVTLGLMQYSDGFNWVAIGKAP